MDSPPVDSLVEFDGAHKLPLLICIAVHTARLKPGGQNQHQTTLVGARSLRSELQISSRLPVNRNFPAYKLEVTKLQ